MYLSFRRLRSSAEAKELATPFACSVSVKDTPLAVDAEVLNDFEGCYSVQLGPLFPKDESRFEPYSIGECGQRICIHDDRV